MLLDMSVEMLLVDNMTNYIPNTGSHTGKVNRKKVMTDANGNDLSCEDCSAK